MRQETYEAMKKLSDMVTSDLGMEPIKFGLSQWHMYAEISDHKSWLLIKIMRAIMNLCDHNMPGVVRSLSIARWEAEQSIAYEQSQTDAENSE
jgi:hypothetical protein